MFIRPFELFPEPPAGSVEFWDSVGVGVREVVTEDDVSLEEVLLEKTLLEKFLSPSTSGSPSGGLGSAETTNPFELKLTSDAHGNVGLKGLILQHLRIQGISKSVVQD